MLNAHAPRPRLLFWTGASLGLAWSVFGLAQFWKAVTATPADLVASGMIAEQAALYAALPLWMDLAFAVGVFGGVIGCALLLMRRRHASPVLAASLVGYLILYVGDITEGVFAALGGPQIAVLTTVVLVAAGLLWLSLDARRRAILV
jgi:hypothetical protein